MTTNPSEAGPDDAISDLEQSNEGTTAANPSEDHGQRGSSREAARYRRQLREAEAERDQLRERFESAQRQLVEQVATGVGIKPEALWASGAQLADLCDESGAIERGRVVAACTAAVESLGLARAGGPDMGQGVRGRAADHQQPWQKAFSHR